MFTINFYQSKIFNAKIFFLLFSFIVGALVFALHPIIIYGPWILLGLFYGETNSVTLSSFIQDIYGEKSSGFEGWYVFLAILIFMILILKKLFSKQAPLYIKFRDLAGISLITILISFFIAGSFQGPLSQLESILFLIPSFSALALSSSLISFIITAVIYNRLYRHTTSIFSIISVFIVVFLLFIFSSFIFLFSFFIALGP